MASQEALAAVGPYEAFLSRPVAQVAADLEHYVALLTKWQRIQNLVSRETLAVVWARHIADSLQVLSLLRPSDRNFIDLGSGGGLPAIPLAIASRGSDRRFALVEPVGRKGSFLRTVARELSLPVIVHTARIEELDSRETQHIDVITSRALASLPALCVMIAPLFGPETRAILHKGREHVDEVAAARASWQFDVVSVKSDTDSTGVLLELSHLSPKII